MKCKIWIFIDYPPEWGNEGLWSCPIHMIVDEADVMDRMKTVYALGHTAEIEYLEDEDGTSREVKGPDKGDGDKGS